MASLPERNSSPSGSFLPSPSVSNWSTSLQTVLDQPISSLPARLAVGGTAFFLAFSAWAWFGQIDEVAKAPGKLVPKGETYKINSIEISKVSTIAVKAGETVKAGQLLVELDPSIASKEVERLEKALLAIRIEIVQVEGMLDKTKLQAETQTAIAENGIQEQQVVIDQATLTTEGNRAVLAQLEDDAIAQKERMERLQPLREVGAISADRIFEAEQMLRDRQRTIIESQSNLNRALAETQRLRVQLNEKEDNAAQVRLESQQKIKELEVKLSNLRSQYSETQILLDTAQTKLEQRYLYAPVSGTVLTLNVHREGEVVQPGQVIAEVAPKGKPLVLSTLLPSQEAGFVKPGMEVQIKHDAYPFQEYGVIAGQVVSVSPDSKPNEQIGQVYEVEIELTKDHITSKGQPLRFKAGQTATGEIVTRRRRIADVLLDPLKKLQGSTSL